MKTLLILRHAKSSWENPALSDYDRPLNKRGKRDAPRMAEHIKQQGLTPDYILTSSAKRARKTASKVANTCGYTGKIMQLDRLYLAPVGVYLEYLKGLSNKYQCVMAVGHNPTMEQLVSHLSGEHQRMPTAAIAHFELPIEKWKMLDLSTKGKLVNLWTPKSLFNT